MRETSEYANRNYVNQKGEPIQGKPETMTLLAGKVLVEKDHPRILFRGQLDLMEGKVTAIQTILEAQGAGEALLGDLDDVIALLREFMRSEYLDVPPRTTALLGLTPEELRAQSHDPKGYFGVDAMTPVHRSMGLCYVLLNELRAESRALETTGVAAFREGTTPAQAELLRWLNRLSSAFHIMMCRVRSGRY